MRRACFPVVASMAACLAFPAAFAQSTSAKDLAAGKLLVASRDLPDPNFAETVILLVQHKDDGTLGLVINRRTRVPLSRVLREVKGAAGRTDPVHLGGPVSRSAILALRRSAANPGGDAVHVFGDVYMITSRPLLEQALASAVPATAFRVYLGYAGWGEGQLAHELELGGWYIFRGDAAMIFDADPDSIWTRLIGRTDLRIARSNPLRFAPGR